jgi:Do/DeqQ family serine protease
MNLNRSLIRVPALLLVLVSGVVAARLIGRAAEPSPAIRVDNSPISRDPQSGNSYSPVIKQVAPSVVNIYSTHLRYNPLMADPFFRHFFGSEEVEPKREQWLGCGIIVAPDGYILTANHVVKGAVEIKVAIQNGTTYSARVVGSDPPTDVAILKIDGKNLPAVTLGDSDQLEVGDVVLAIGNPFGIGQTVTRGIISALGRSLSGFEDEDSGEVRQYQNFIQTDAAINEGNSGGALVDVRGRLIGINDAIFSPSHTSAGIGFAVPINLARSVMEGFLREGRVARGYMGVQSQDLDAIVASRYGAPTSEGALVTLVTPGSPAAKGGLLADDVVVGINGKNISSEDNLKVIVSQLAPGSEAKLKIFRDGVAKTIAVTLSERPDTPAAAAVSTADPAAAPAKADALTGVEVQDLTPRIRRQLGSDQNLNGALIMNVDRASNSYEGGLRPGDVILEVNRQAVGSAEEAVRLCRAARTDNIMVKIWRPDRLGGRIRVLHVDNAKH